jgi:hypothetical protein
MDVDLVIVCDCFVALFRVFLGCVEEEPSDYRFSYQRIVASARTQLEFITI